MNGIERETWLLEYQGQPFVYVAGQKDVVLGWDVDQCPLGEGVLRGLREEYAESQEDMEYNSWEEYMTRWNENLRQCLSPLRTADIGDMIVEVDSRYLQEDVPSLAQAVHTLKEGPFALATEDEWEYFCNGGARTLFRWGDTLQGILAEIYRVSKAASILKQPNMLGLRIAYNSYKNEIIDSTQYVKGGDGGGSLCGGDGAIYVLPCYTAFYRQRVNYGILKEYYSYRRIVRLP